jgi:membrane protein implicated in regulation of membrane protease activity
VALIGAVVLAVFVVPAPWGIVVVAAGALLEVGEAWFWWRRSHRRRPAVGVESLVGMRATVVTPCRPEGRVRLGGELWQGRCAEGADQGDSVEVVAVEGLTLVVRR